MGYDDTFAMNILDHKDKEVIWFIQFYEIKIIFLAISYLLMIWEQVPNKNSLCIYL